MECINCGYYYADETELEWNRCYCHWVPLAPGEIAPCNEEEEYIPNDYYGDEEDSYDPNTDWILWG